MSTEVFKAKSRAKLVELALQSGASVIGKIGWLGWENLSACQEGANKVSTARRLSIMLNYVLNLSDYAGMSDVSSNACIV